MKYAVDRIEDNIVILQELKTGKIIEVNKNTIKFKVKDRDILIYKDNKYIKDNKEKEKRLKELQTKFNKVKGK